MHEYVSASMFIFFGFVGAFSVISGVWVISLLTAMSSDLTAIRRLLEDDAAKMKAERNRL